MVKNVNHLIQGDVFKKKKITKSEFYHLKSLYFFDCSLKSLRHRSQLLTFADDKHLTEAFAVQCTLSHVLPL